MAALLQEGGTLARGGVTSGAIVGRRGKMRVSRWFPVVEVGVRLLIARKTAFANLRFEKSVRFFKTRTFEKK